MITEEEMEKSRVYNLGVMAITITYRLVMFFFEFFVILFDIPAVVWYGWLSVLEKNSDCGPQDDTDGEQNTYGIWM